MTTTVWQDPDVARRFVEERRAAIPYGSDQLQMMLQLLERFRPEPARLLDLGCGDGILARAVLHRFHSSTAVLFDHSEPMLERAREACAGLGDRVRLVRGDLAAPLADQVEGPFDAVISGFAIHHLPHERKPSLYAEIFEILSPGGLFVNIEHVASESMEGEALFDAAFVDRIVERTGKPRETVEQEYYGRADKADNILAPLETQLGWLREIGFLHVDCYFKWLELALFAGQRGGG